MSSPARLGGHVPVGTRDRRDNSAPFGSSRRGRPAREDVRFSFGQSRQVPGLRNFHTTRGADLVQRRGATVILSSTPSSRGTVVVATSGGGNLWGGVAALIIGVAMLAFAALSFVFGNLPGGIALSVIGGLTTLTGIALITAHFVNGTRESRT